MFTVVKLKPGCAPSYERVYRATLTVLRTLQRGSWHCRADLMSAVQRETRLSREQIRARLKDFGLLPRLHSVAASSDDKGVLLRKGRNVWELRLN